MVTHDEILQELLKRLAAKEFTGAAIARLLGIPPARVSDLKRGTRRIQQQEMPILARFLGMEAPAGEDSESSIIWVPVIGMAAAGGWKEAVQVPAYSIPRSRKNSSDNMFAVEVFGDSMDKLIPDGGVAIINPDEKRLYDGRVYLIENHDFEATIKIYRVNPSRFEPASHNPSHKTIYADEHKISVLGRVVGAWSDHGF